MESKINITTEKDRVFIYEGKAPEVKEPKILNINGQIDAPARWLKNKEVDELVAHIIVDREKMVISMKMEETDPWGSSITGRMEYDPTFIKFGINSGDYKTPNEMAQFFKMNRSFFDNQSNAMNLVTELQNFRAKVESIVEKSENTRGDKRSLYAQTVASNIPEKFKLFMPIFKGQAKQVFEVEIYIKPEDLTCTLVSPEANDFAEQFRNVAIDHVLEIIQTVKPNITIIEI